MKRRPRIIKLCVFLLLGAIINVAVAWGISWRSMAVNARHLGWGWDSPDHPVVTKSRGTWLVWRYESFGTEVIGSSWGKSVWLMGRTAEGELFEQLPRWGAFLVPSADDRRGQATLRIAMSRGWPLPALYSIMETQDFGNLKARTSTDLATYVGISLGGETTAIPSPNSVYVLPCRRILPTCPIWPGFAINTIFYAAFLWLFFAVPGFVCRRIPRATRPVPGVCVSGWCERGVYGVRERIAMKRCRKRTLLMVLLLLTGGTLMNIAVECVRLWLFKGPPYIDADSGQLRLYLFSAPKSLWPAMWIGAIFYAASLWLLFAIPRFVRCRIRARRGHARIKTPKNDPGGFRLFRLPNHNDHLGFAKHLIAERQVEEFDPRRGRIIRWEPLSRNNHWLDSTMLACVAGSIAGARLMAEAAPRPTMPIRDWFAQQKRSRRHC